MTDARFDIWPVLESYGWELPQARGTWQSIKCFAHTDTHASCRISSDAGQVKCLACDFKGDAIDVVKFYEGVGFKDAVRRCEAITGSSSDSVQRTDKFSSSVSGRERDKREGRAYTPPRLRGGTSDRSRRHAG